MGPVVLRSIAPAIHAAGGVLDCHLMVDDPAHHFEEIAASGGDSVTFHVEAAGDPGRRRGCSSCARPRRRRRLQPGDDPRLRPPTPPGCRCRDRPLHEHPSRATRVRRSCPRRSSGSPSCARLVDVPVQVDGGVGEENARAIRDAGASLLVCGSAIFADARPGERLQAHIHAAVVVSHLDRAIALAERGRGTTYPNPVVGAVVVSPAGEVVGEGWHERKGEPHAEIARAARRRRRALAARRCTSRSSRVRTKARRRRAPTPLSRPGSRRVVIGSLDPNPEAAGGAERLRAAGVEVELVDSFEARRQNEAWRTWVSERPAVRHATRSRPRSTAA